MKTPDYVEFVKVTGGGQYNPSTGEYSEGTKESWGAPCLVMPMAIEKQFDEYGTRDRQVVSILTNETQIRNGILEKPFDHVLITCARMNLVEAKHLLVEQSYPEKGRIRVERMA